MISSKLSFHHGLCFLMYRSSIIKDENISSIMFFFHLSVLLYLALETLPEFHFRRILKISVEKNHSGKKPNSAKFPVSLSKFS